MKKVIATLIVGACLAASAIGCNSGTDTSKKSVVPATPTTTQVAQNDARP